MNKANGSDSAAENAAFCLREVLLKLRVSQRQLAFRLGCEENQISAYVNGKRFPSWAKARRIAEALGVPLDCLASGTVPARRRRKA